MTNWLSEVINQDDQTVLIESHRRIQAEQVELRRTLERLMPAFVELRAVLNELSKAHGG